MSYRTLGFGLMLLLIVGSSAAVEPFVFAQLTDTHVADSGSSEDLRIVLSDLRRHDDLPEFVLVTGDLSDFGETATLNRYAEIMEKSGFVHYSVPGNHDSRWSGLELAAQEVILTQAQPFSFVYKGVQFIGLNSALPLEAWGHIDASQILWLEQEMSRVGSELPRILFCHHPFLYPDRSYQPESERLMQVIESGPVVLFLSGHGHSFKHWTVNSVRHQMGAATVRSRSYQLVHIDEKTIRIEQWVAGESVPRESRKIDLWPKKVASFAIDSSAADHATGELGFYLCIPHKDDYDSATWWLRRNHKTAVPLRVDTVAVAALDTLDRWLPGFNTAIITAEWPDGSRVLRRFDFTLGTDAVQPLWQVDLHDRIQASLAVADQLIVAGKSGKVWALRPEDGSVLWSQTLHGDIRKGLTCSQER
ncbi:metallophosphoesterase, partial [candidate division KSB1 bacterium]|nr:metallophosphoesterase [candidate division KSB1 bacterium]